MVFVIQEFDHPDDVQKPHWEYSYGDHGLDKRKHKLVSSSSCPSSSNEPSNMSNRWVRHYLVGVPQQFLSDLFLPVDYPNSVRSEYMAYQICDSLQGLSSYLRGVVASSAVLEAAGVGNAEATAMSAAMTWALRDGLGMVGGLIFSYTTSFYFDAHVKEFRLFADVINDVGLTLDMLAPKFTNSILYITSIATVCKIMCGISAGATKGSITQHFCLRGNMADLNAKEGTQETLMSLIGMMCGVYLAKFLSRLERDQGKSVASSWSWTIFNILTLLHVYINYLGVKLLRLRTLNRQRAKECLSPLITACALNVGRAKNDWGSELQRIAGPEAVAESLLGSTCNLILTGTIKLNSSFSELSLSVEDLSNQLDEIGRKYLVSCDGKKVQVCLFKQAQDCDQLKAFVEAGIIEKCLIRKSFNSKTLQQARECVKVLEEQGFGLPLLADRGWDVGDQLYLGFGRRRVVISNLMEKEE